LHGFFEIRKRTLTTVCEHTLALRTYAGIRIVDKFIVNTKVLPAFRFVDLNNAVERVLSKNDRVHRIQSDNPEDLSDLLHDDGPEWASRKINRSERTAWQTGEDDEVFLPVDQYWIFNYVSDQDNGCVIVRLRYKQQEEKAILEVAGRQSHIVDEYIHKFVDESLSGSLYRGRLLTMTYEAGTRDEFGDIEKSETLRINFKVARPVPKEDFVVDEEVHKVLWRNTIDLHLRRDLLKSYGVPIRRGVLLYGPPGTGKTFACRYICGQLPNVTKIMVAGSALNKISQIFEFSRMYQPSIVILEDVDLVFSARDINLYSSALGDLLDQMDGLRPFEDVGIILTTNSIERMEAAIKDRPGRIGQCIYFGPPGKELRGRYIAQYAKDYDYQSADLNRLIVLTSGTTPAFIKEWIHRTAQIATERIEAEGMKLKLLTEDFEEAYAEMRRYTEGSSGQIIGFLRTE